jgi:hypothetical protein
MRYFLLITVLSLASCQNDTKTKSVAVSDENVEPRTAAVTASGDPLTNIPAGPVTEAILGSFVGPFGDNKITILITSADGDSVKGRSIVGGNDRPFAGVKTLESGIYRIHAVEPGDDTHDGVFDFDIPEKDPSTLSGKWQPYDKKLKAKEYSLRRREFKYDASVGSYPEASQRLLKPEDVENMMKEDLEFMRNEIFARHGFCFKKKHLRQQFENEDWYVPHTVDIKGHLTDTEKKNIEMIKRYEKYAEEYGDEYGR